MRRLLVALLFIAVIVAVTGFYRGWFSFKSDSADQKSNFTFSVDKEKVQADRKNAVESAQGLGRKITDRVGGASGKNMEGTVVAITSDKLTMTDKDGKEHSHTLAADVKVTCDGKDCKTEDLRTGMRIRMTTHDTAPHAVTRIDALDKNPDFGKVG